MTSGAHLPSANPAAMQTATQTDKYRSNKLRRFRSSGVPVAGNTASSVSTFPSMKPSINIDGLVQKNSLAGASGLPCTTGPFQACDHILQFFERLGIEGIIHPSAFTSIIQQACILECLQMKGEARLRRIKRGHEIAHTLFTLAETFDDPQAGFVGQSMKPARDLL